MVALARKSLLHGWRRFLPACIAVGVAGILLLVQAALLRGIFGSASVYVRKSNAHLWIGYPGTPTVELGRAIPERIAMRVRFDPDVVRVEPFQWFDGEWRTANHGTALPVFISGIDPNVKGLMFAAALTPTVRAQLYEPGAIIVDRADLDKLSVRIGESAWINGHRVRVVAAERGLRALGGINVLASLTTARYLAADPARAEDVAYWVVALRAGVSATAAQARLNPRNDAAGYAVWTAQDFATRASNYWLFETGAGLGFIFLAIVIFGSGVLIATQTLAAAVASSLPEYATLRALGVGQSQLRRVVLEQAVWVGGLGLLLALGTTAIAVPLARSQDVPAELGAFAVVMCSAAVLLLMIVAGVIAARTLRRSDPAMLLR